MILFDQAWNSKLRQNKKAHLKIQIQTLVQTLIYYRQLLQDHYPSQESMMRKENQMRYLQSNQLARLLTKKRRQTYLWLSAKHEEIQNLVQNSRNPLSISIVLSPISLIWIFKYQKLTMRL